AEGAAGRNSGFMIDLPHDLASDNYAGALAEDQAQIADNRDAIDFALETAAAFDMPEEAIRKTGKINVAASPRGAAHNDAFARHLDALGEPYERLDASAMRAITGSCFFTEGLRTPGAAIVQPALFARGAARGLSSNSVSIHERSAVLSLTRCEDVWAAETQRGSVRAPRVILAVNGLVERFGRFKGRLAHVLTYASMTRALNGKEVARLGGAREWAATPADPLGTTVRRISGIGGDRLVIRNRFHYAPSMAAPDGWEADVARTHDASFIARFPMLAHVPMQFRWGGRLCLSLNDAPAFGEIEEGLFAACCHNGLGLARGTFSGVAAADLAAGIDSRFARRQSGRAGPRRLPPAPIATLGARVKIAYGERRAGVEL
ncbi:MAG: FAD-binding oxidoreductase, partial [Pseudomonadota bacterium]